MATEREQRNRPRHVTLALGWYDRNLHLGIARYAKEAGWVLHAGAVRHTSYETGQFDGILTLLTGGPDPDGRAPSTDIYHLVERASVPVVNLGGDTNNRNIAHVVLDLKATGSVVAQHFLERGFKHLAFCSDSWWKPNWREEGFAQTAEAAGVPVERLNLHDAAKNGRSLQATDGAQWLAAQLKRLPKPLGVMAVSDEFAVTVLDACRSAEINVPEELALIGCDNNDLVCEFAAIPLSSLDPGLDRNGYEGAKLLDRLMDGDPLPSEVITIQPEGVVVRQSSDIVAIEHLAVAKAVRYIATHYQSPQMNVDDVATATGMSRTGLNKAFRGHLGKAIGHEIRRVRLEKARALLAHSKLSVMEVATQCGYSSEKHLRDSLRRETNLTPRAFRYASRSTPPPAT